MPEPLDLDRLKADLETAARAVRGASWPGEMAQRMDELADRLAAYPAQMLDERDAWGVRWQEQFNRAETLEAERDDARREAVRENARNVQATAERDHISEGNVKLRRERDAALDERDRLRELIDIADQDEIARLREENTALEDDVLRAISERNEVARIAAAEIHPGPDGADDEIRRELIRSWLDEGRDDAEGWREMFQRAVLKPCPHVIRGVEGTAHCGLDADRLHQLTCEVDRLQTEREAAVALAEVRMTDRERVARERNQLRAEVAGLRAARRVTPDA